MIEGVVNATREAVISLRIQGTTGQTRDIEAVVDTGYNRYLALPPELAAELELPYAYRGWAVLANADEVDFDVHAQRFFGMDDRDTSRPT